MRPLCFWFPALIGYNSGMIRTARPRRCFCCQQALATRAVLDRPGRDGKRRLIPLCRRCPSPLEIDARAKVIAWAWSDDERYARHFGMPVSGVESHRAVRYDEVLYELVTDD